MGDRPILSVKAGGPPGFWRDLEVRLASNGRLIPDVREANAHEGWYVQALRRSDGNLDINPLSGTVRTRRVHRRIRITRRAG
jgi:hypothetical protein